MQRDEFELGASRELVPDTGRAVGPEGGGEVDRFFAGREESRAVFESLMRAVRAEFGADAVSVRVQKSQVTIHVDGAAAARVWIPARYLGERAAFAPLVLSVVLRRRDGSPRWKEVVQVGETRWTHHLEVRSPDVVDAEVLGWMREELATRSAPPR